MGRADRDVGVGLIVGGSIMKKILERVLQKAREAEQIVIVGAGKVGRELLTHLKDEDGVVIHAFMDNNKAIVGNSIDNIKIIAPCKIENTLYIIAIENYESQQAIHMQLMELGVNEEFIIVYYRFRNYGYLKSVDEKNYKEEISEMYYDRLGREMDWENPVTYTQKINWEKLNVKDERRTRLADKYLVRDWVKEKIGEKYLTKLYGVWDDANDIDFELLPNAFVLKMNHASNRNIVVKDKTKINQEEVRKQLNAWKKHNHAYSSFELHYKNIVPKIICEEYLEGVADQVYDYNIYCFHGKPEYIWCIKGSHKPECQASFYNPNWELLPFSYFYPKDPILAPRPEKLEEMLEISRILSAEFKHVRVDLYNLPDGRVLFGEMTFSTCGGLEKFQPDEYDTIWGNMI